MKKLAALTILWAAMSGAMAQTAKPADVATVDGIIAALYDTISGTAGQQRDWDRLRSLFKPEGRMVVHGPNKEGGMTTRVLTVEDYITRAGANFAKEGFFESELSRSSQQFGQIAHVFSTYEARHAKGDKPFMRGINSIQLVNDGQRWWVQSLLWQAESEKNPLPAEYLKPR